MAISMASIDYGTPFGIEQCSLVPLALSHGMPEKWAVLALVLLVGPFSCFWGLWWCHCRISPSMADVGHTECYSTLPRPPPHFPPFSTAGCKHTTPLSQHWNWSTYTAHSTGLSSQYGYLGKKWWSLRKPGMLLTCRGEAAVLIGGFR